MREAAGAIVFKQIGLKQIGLNQIGLNQIVLKEIGLKQTNRRRQTTILAAITRWRRTPNLRSKTYKTSRRPMRHHRLRRGHSLIR